MTCSCGCQSPSKQVGQSHCRYIHGGHRTRVPRDGESFGHHPIGEADQKQRVHRHDRENRDAVARVRHCQQRPLPVEHVVESQDEQIEEIAAEDVADAQIDRADAHGCERDDNFGQRRR